MAETSRSRLKFRYDGVCDKDGCDLNPWRLGDHSFYGPGGDFTLDTTKPMTVVTQFITDDGTDSGRLAEIRRVWVQGGTVIQNADTNMPGLHVQLISWNNSPSA